MGAINIPGEGNGAFTRRSEKFFIEKTAEEKSDCLIYWQIIIKHISYRSLFCFYREMGLKERKKDKKDLSEMGKVYNTL